MKTMYRSRAVEDLRHELIRIAGDEESACQVAARLKIFCNGFAQWTYDELRERYWWLASKHPRVSRQEFEDLANRWQMARQMVRDTELSCDTQVQRRERPICGGWEHFTNAELSRFYDELLGEAVRVLFDPREGATEPDPPQASLAGDPPCRVEGDDSARGR